MIIRRQSVAAAFAVLAAATLAPRNLNAAGQATLQAPDRPVILAVGESTTAGYGGQESKTLCNNVTLAFTLLIETEEEI